jgi:hypothetical protein
VLGAVPLLEAELHSGDPLPAIASVTLLNPDYELATFVGDTGPRLRRLSPIVTIYGDPADQALLLAELANGATALLKRGRLSSRAASAAWGSLQRAMGRAPVGGPHGPGGEEVELTVDTAAAGGAGAARAGPVGEAHERRWGWRKAEAAPAAEAPADEAAAPDAAGDAAPAAEAPAAEAKAATEAAAAVEEGVVAAEPAAAGGLDSTVAAAASWWRRSASEGATRSRAARAAAAADGAGDVEAGGGAAAPEHRRGSLGAFASGRWRASLGRSARPSVAGGADDEDAASAWRRAAAAVALMADEAARLTGLAPVVDWWTARPKRAGGSRVLIAPTSGDLAHGMWREKRGGLSQSTAGAPAPAVAAPPPSSAAAAAAAARGSGGGAAPAHAGGGKHDKPAKPRGPPMSDEYLSLGRRWVF